MRPRRLLAALFCAALLSARFGYADAWDPPSDFYDDADGLTESDLKDELLSIMTTGHILRTYGNFRDSAAIHDADPSTPGNILLVYNRESIPAAWTSGATWDREHIWPQSLQGGGSVNNNDTGVRADPHVLRPCKPSINGSRGNKPFGFDNTTGGYGAVPLSSYYFPGDADKGDVARELFYMDTRWTATGPDGIELTDSVPGGYQMGDLSSLVTWHYLDAPDDFERGRNHKIYSQALNPLYYTNNRNAFVDRPEYVWSIYMDQMNDSQISIAGSSVGGDGGSSRNVDLGRIFVGGSVPGPQNFTLNKSGADGTYYEVTTSEFATSSVTGRHNLMQIGGTDSESITVGLKPTTDTATAGLRSETVTIDNLDVTTQGGEGHGDNDENDTFNINLSVLKHATPSFESGMEDDTLIYDFGSVSLGSIVPNFSFDVFNFETTAGFTADLDFDSVMSTGDDSVLTTDLGGAAGALSIAGGIGQMFSAMIDTSAAGLFSATYTLMFSDEDLAGALNSSLTLTLTGEVTSSAGLVGDYNGDGMVDASDYIVWRKTYGESVPAFSGADGDGDTLIGDGDYGVWSANYGAVAPGGGSGGSAQVPEPATIWLAMALAGCGVSLSRKRRFGR